MLAIMGLCIGLSPRGRGNLLDCSEHRRRARSIPAWAGEPFSVPTYAKPQPVYPRVGGGTTSVT